MNAFPSLEEQRLLALHALGLLDDRLGDETFEQVVRLGQALLGTSICLVSLVAHDRLAFAAAAGTDAKGMPRGRSFCDHAIRSDHVLVVEDTALDDRFATQYMGRSDSPIRFYAGAPIKLPHGYRIGTVCVLDHKPRPAFSDHERAVLSALADLALRSIAATALGRELDQARSALDRREEVFEDMGVAIAFLDLTGAAEFVSLAFQTRRSLEISEDLDQKLIPLSWLVPPNEATGADVWDIVAPGGPYHVARTASGFTITAPTLAT